MNARDQLMTVRFTTNMERISNLILLAQADIKQLKSTKLFASEGARADIWRAIIVFLHATFEDVLRTASPANKGPLNFHSRADLRKALKHWKLDPAPFESLFPPLTEMAKRRQRIVHEADLFKDDTTSRAWGIVDNWQLMMWATAVPTFYWLLRSKIEPKNDAAVAVYSKLREGMDKIVAVGNGLVEFANSPSDLQILRERATLISQSAQIAIETITQATLLTAKVEAR